MSLQILLVIFCYTSVILVQCDVINRCSDDVDNLLLKDVEAKLILTDDRGTGKPLYLSKYIKEGKLGKARRLASVKPFVGNVTSYSGYLTVDERYNSNMFFWYFKSEHNYESDPTVVWLQGGPGSNLYLGLFNENGPYVICENRIYKRNHTWSKISNLIYFDNPVGTGYSFTDNGYAQNQTKVGEDLYVALVQLLKLFPYLQKNKLFVTGESYGGKYVPSLGHTIHKMNQNKPEIFIDMKGLMIGDGFTDPLHMLKYGDYLYQLGLIDNNIRHEFRQIERKATRLIKQRKWNETSDLFQTAMGDTNTSLFFKYTGFGGYYNYFSPNAGGWMDYETTFINSSYFRRHVHVGDNQLNDGLEVYKNLYEDIPKSVITWVEELLNHYKILFYNGQLDIICAYPLTENVLKEMKWPLSSQYKKAKRRIFHVNGDVAGYYKTVGNLTEALIRDAGHMVPANQPVWAFQLFSDFLYNRFNSSVPNYRPYYKTKLLYDST